MAQVFWFQLLSSKIALLSLCWWRNSKSSPTALFSMKPSQGVKAAHLGLICESKSPLFNSRWAKNSGRGLPAPSFPEFSHFTDRLRRPFAAHGEHEDARPISMTWLFSPSLIPARSPQKSAVLAVLPSKIGFAFWLFEFWIWNLNWGGITARFAQRAKLQT